MHKIVKIFLFIIFSYVNFVNLHASIVAVVNKQIISLQDLNNSIKFAILSSGMPDNEETRNVLRERILNSLITEQLQIQKAKEFSIDVTEQDIAQGIFSIEKQNNMKKGDLQRFLKKHDLPLTLMKKQIKASMVWRDYISAKFRQSINIGVKEVQNEIKRRDNLRKESRYEISEIVLKTDDSQKEKTYDQALTIIEQLQKGTPFNLLAKQFSNSASAAAGGKIGWISYSNITKEIQSVIEDLNIREYSEPIFDNGSYRIIYLHQKLSPGQYAPPQTFVSFKRVIIKTPEGAFKFEVEDQIAKIKSVAKSINSCKKVDKLVGKDADVNSVHDVPEESLPGDLQKLFENLKIGQATAPIYTGEGIIFFVLCDKKVSNPKLPSEGIIKSHLISKKLHSLAMQEMKSLRSRSHIKIYD